MASLIDELIEVLDGENKIYEAYIDIAREKTTFIVKNDLEGLSDIVGKEQLIIEHVNNLDKKREELAKDIADVLALDTKNVTIKDIATAIRNQKGEYERLTEVFKALKKTLSMVERVNMTNSQLIAETMDMINFEINLAQASRMQPMTADYGKADVADMNAASKKFDAKQ
ncbi:MAG TPA: hypothetical protein DCX21_04840 [Eubacterium sp.]|nr:hypothetical protein [Eubacterium sp.]HBZ52572.1 hypothetical protein [Eubacterium sp.]